MARVQNWWLSKISVEKINDVIGLAQARSTNYKANPNDNYIQLNKDLDTYLENLNYDEVKSLMAIMYLGRDKDFRTLTLCNRKHKEIRQWVPF